MVWGWILIGLKNFFWDFCVFICYLIWILLVGIVDIEEFILDVNVKLLVNRWKIYYLIIVMVEIWLRFFVWKSFGFIDDLFLELGLVFEFIDLNLNILKVVGELWDVILVDLFIKKLSMVRIIGILDVIYLMICLYVCDVFGIYDIVFYMFDIGKGKNWEGRCVLFFGFKDWFFEGSWNVWVEEVCFFEILFL